MTSANQRLLGQLPGVTAVGSGDLLGIWWITLCLWLVVVVICLRVNSASFYKHYSQYCEHRRKDDQNPCQAKKPAGQLDKLLGLSLQLLCGLGLLIGNKKMYLRRQCTLMGINIGTTRKSVHVVDVLPKNLSSEIIHKSNNAKMPNVES